MARKFMGYVGIVHNFVQALNMFDLKGRAIAGIFSLMMIVLCGWAIVNGKDIPAGVQWVYGVVVGSLTVNKTAELFKKGAKQ